MEYELRFRSYIPKDKRGRPRPRVTQCLIFTPEQLKRASKEKKDPLPTAMAIVKRYIHDRENKALGQFYALDKIIGKTAVVDKDLFTKDERKQLWSKFFNRSKSASELPH